MNPSKSPRKPAAVKAVESAMRASAGLAGYPARRVGCHHSTGSYPPFDGDEWIVGDNYESGMSSMIYRAGSWFYRSPSTGEDRPVPGGQAEALSNASIAFTG